VENFCHCGSGLRFDECCEPFINGQSAPLKPVQVMRSRYTAFVIHNIDYLIATWHPDCHAEQWRKDIIADFPMIDWRGLTIKNESPGKNTHESFVEFLAVFFDKRTQRTNFIHERSRFVRLSERWYYIDGIHQHPLRNAPCPCGSGKKYKKCCGQ
jgi:SEC-C motif-containing protein